MEVDYKQILQREEKRLKSKQQAALTALLKRIQRDRDEQL
jgi:hypothetical protein